MFGVLFIQCRPHENHIAQMCVAVFSKAAPFPEYDICSQYVCIFCMPTSSVHTTNSFHCIYAPVRNDGGTFSRLLLTEFDD